MSSTPTLEVRILRSGAVLPEYKSDGAAGMDLSACFEDGKGVVIVPGAIMLIPTGLALGIPDGFEGQVRPRSGLSTKHGVTMPNSPGTIDSDYRGELLVPLINLGRESFEISQGMRIAQLVIAPVSRAAVVRVESLSPTRRGGGGFGSTGAQ